MITVGIDCGSQYTKAVLLNDGEMVSMARIPTAFDVDQAAREVYEIVLNEAGYDKPDAVAATGVFRDNIDFVKNSINEVSAAAKGAYLIRPETELVIDIGAESCRAVRLKEDGKVKHYAVNDKCASGAGTFIETMARTLQLDIAQMGEYSLRHTKDIAINAQCVVFAESEVVSLIHQQEQIEDIAHGIHAGIASKVGALVRREGLADIITLIGGPSVNAGLVACIQKELGRDIFVPRHNAFISAAGAAVYAASLENPQD